MKIIYIIAGLYNGGAEMMLYKLIKNLDKSKYEIEVISMVDKGVMGNKIEGLGVKVHTLDMKRGIPDFRMIARAREVCNDADIIQSWMYHADLFGYMVYKKLKKKNSNLKLIWGIRHSNFNMKTDKKSTLLIMKINSLLSKRVDRIVSCSEIAKEIHVKYGYKAEKIVVIPNGFELERYTNCKNSIKYVQDTINKKGEYKTVIRVARWHPMKDYTNFIKAMKLVVEKNSNVAILMCGKSIDENNKELVQLLSDNNIYDNTFLLGRRDDINQLMPGCDLFVSSSSYGEGFPNVIGEAMACETPCVVTDVGDSKLIVGDYGLAVEKNAPILLAEAITKIIEMDEKDLEKLGKKARKRIQENYDIKLITKKFESLYRDLLR